MNFNTMQYFMDVVECKSFTKAAEKNFIAQTAVSHAIARLENEFGTRLLERSHGSVLLTEAGAVFYDECRQVLALHTKTIQSIAKLKKEIIEIKIGFIDIYECRNFSGLMTFLNRKFPQYKINWVDRYSVSEKNLDISIGYDFEYPNVSSKTKVMVDDYPYACLLSKEHMLAQEKNITLSMLENQKLIVLLRNRNINVERFEKKFRKRYLPHISCKILFAYSALERRTLVEYNSGIALVEKELFRFSQEQCTEIDVSLPFGITYYIKWKDEQLKAVAEAVQQYFLIK
jgi:DNA-binding transcriptional LysR family regulator